MAYNYHVNRIQNAFKRAAISPNEAVRAQAHYDLALRLKGIIERSLTRDDTHNKQRKQLGLGYEIEISPQANNSLIVAYLVEAKKEATQEAARLNPSKYANTNTSLVI